jgi:Rrf2 family protein
MLSQKARYALRALFVLCEHPGNEPVQAADIAEQAAVPRKFLEQILLQLKKSGLVFSQRGKFGGYILGRAPHAITFAEVIRAIDGPLALAPCASRTAYRKCDDCVDEETCAIRRVLMDVRDATAGILESRTLEQALRDGVR